MNTDKLVRDLDKGIENLDGKIDSLRAKLSPLEEEKRKLEKARNNLKGIRNTYSEFDNDSRAPSQRIRIVEFLTQHPYRKPAEIARECNIPPGSVNSVLTKLKQQGKIIKDDDGLYSVRK